MPLWLTATVDDARDLLRSGAAGDPLGIRIQAASARPHPQVCWRSRRPAGVVCELGLRLYGGGSWSRPKRVIRVPGDWLMDLIPGMNTGGAISTRTGASTAETRDTLLLFSGGPSSSPPFAVGPATGGVDLRKRLEGRPHPASDGGMVAAVSRGTRPPPLTSSQRQRHLPLAVGRDVPHRLWLLARSL